VCVERFFGRTTYPAFRVPLLEMRMPLFFAAVACSLLLLECGFVGGDVLDAMFKLGSRTDEPVLVPGFSKDWQLAAFHNETFEGGDNGCLMEMHRRNFMNVIDYPELTTVAFMGSPDLLVNMPLMTMFTESILRISRSQMAKLSLDQLISVERVSTDFLVQKIAVFLEMAPVQYTEMLQTLEYTMTVVLKSLENIQNAELTREFVGYCIGFERVLVDFGLEIVTITLNFSYCENSDLVHEVAGITLLFFCIMKLEEIKCNELEEKISIAFSRLVTASNICQAKPHRELFLQKQKPRNAFSRLVLKCVKVFVLQECKEILNELGWETVDLKAQCDFLLEEKADDARENCPVQMYKDQVVLTTKTAEF